MALMAELVSGLWGTKCKVRVVVDLLFLTNWEEDDFVTGQDRAGTGCVESSWLILVYTKCRQHYRLHSNGDKLTEPPTNPITRRC